jgi:peroxiredoxin
MNLSRVVLCLVILSLFAAYAGAANRAPMFKGHDLNRHTVRLEEMIKQGPVLIVFWATCCSNTITLMNHMEQLHLKYSDQGFGVLGLAENDTKTVAQVKPWVKARRLTLPVILDPESKILRLYHVQATPHLILIGQDSTITYSHSGFLPGDEKACESAIRTVLGLGEEKTQPDEQ